MIPGPVELSPRVAEAASARPLGHMSKPVVEAFGRALKAMREVWKAPATAQPFVVSGSGTVAMELAVANLVEPGTQALLVSTGYFSERMAEMIRRHGGEPVIVAAPPGGVPSLDEVTRRLDAAPGCKLLFATHVDTSTGVLVDPAPLAKLARERGLLSVFDGVCATAGERFEMEAWGADVYLSASQKALGLPPGLGLLVASERAIEARARRNAPPPLSLDWQQWIPIMQGYESGAPKYFATPATSLIIALDVGLAELCAIGVEQVFEQHRAAAETMRGYWQRLGLRALPESAAVTANTMSALYYPDGVDAALIGKVLAQDVIIAGGLLQPLAPKYFRVGHMGWTSRQPELLARTAAAIASALGRSL